MSDERPDLRNLELGALEALLSELGEPAYRARQVFRWIQHRGVRTVDEMSDVSKVLREKLKQHATLSSMEAVKVERASDGTRKFAFRTGHGDIVESVFIPDSSSEGRNTLCISSQVGCALDCKFCLTATLGLIRNLGFGEIVEQITRVKEDLGCLAGAKGKIPEGVPTIGNVVMMGMGEPLQNYSNLIPALRTMNDDLSHNISTRRITVSTVGLVPRIERLGHDIGVNLAVSLNATTDDVRDKIMPINKRYNIEALLDACRRFPLPARRRITFEYVMLKDLNDSDADARRLIKLLRDIRCKINLIPFNEHEYSPFERPSDERVNSFKNIVGGAGYSIFVRTPRGDDISAACGQLGSEVDAPRKLHVIQ